MNRADSRRHLKIGKKAAENAKLVQTVSTFSVEPALFSKILSAGLQQHQAGHLPEAERSYKQVLQADPDQPVALHYLGIIASQRGDLDLAVNLMTKSVTVEPNYDQAHYNLGNALRDLKMLEEAITSYHNAIAINPNFIEAHVNVGAILKKSGKLEEAVASYRNALAIEPESAKAHNNLGNALKDLGNLDEAILCHRKAVAIDPQNDFFWNSFAHSIENHRFNSVDDNLWQDLLHLLERPTLSPFHISRPIISALRHHPILLPILELTGSENSEVEINTKEVAEQLSEISLFLRIMELIPIADLEIERMLTFLRRSILEGGVARITSDKGQSFAVALALQCFTNEYIYPETGEEAVAVEQLQQEIAALVETEQNVPPPLITTLGAYRPLYIFPWAQRLCKREWTSNIKEVIERQISEPGGELTLRSQIPRLTAIQDSVSLLVREQYEENPYPRWIKFGTAHKGGAVVDVLQGPTYCVDLEDYESPKSPEILVAGCGTGQQALYTASIYSNARVLAIDLSLSSLSYALRKTRELNFSNIEYAQGDIMELSNIGRQFDLIECVGVLHHLGDPFAGWKVLVDLLRPEGIMKIGLYSDIAHQEIVCGQTLIAEKGYSNTPKNIRQCRQDVISMSKDGNQNMAGLCAIPNFYSLSECRDLLFHVQEHRFTLPEIEVFLQTLKLKFLGFEFGNQYAPSKFKTIHQNKQELTSISLWHEFELMNPDTFLGMYQFWCKKQ